MNKTFIYNRIFLNVIFNNYLILFIFNKIKKNKSKNL